MTNALTLPHQHLVALSPSEVGPAQQQLRTWCQGKIYELATDLKEQRENYRHAITHKWKASAWQRAITKTKARIIYYTKIRKAVEAGFLIIPNFPIEVVAVRVASDAEPKQLVARYDSEVNNAQAQVLPPGEGKYVNETTITKPEQEWDQRQNEGKGAWVTRRRTGSFDDDVDFPVVAVKPLILEATSRAMALNLFDRIGIANHGGGTVSRAQRRADPIVVGQIIDPTKGRQKWREHSVTFFIAWWLNTEAL